MELSGLLLRQLGRGASMTPAFSSSAIVGSAIYRQPGGSLGALMAGTRTKATVGSPDPREDSEKAAASSDSSKAMASYWGVAPPKVTMEDGSAWKWNCFRVYICTIIASKLIDCLVGVEHLIRR